MILIYASLPCGFEAPGKTYKQSEQKQKSKTVTGTIGLSNAKPTLSAALTAGKTDTWAVEGTDSKA